MAQFTETYDTNDVVGAREELADAIFNVDPTETPCISNARRGPKPRSIFPEWQIDEFAPPDTGNAQIEADDISAYDAATPTERLGNRLQISRKTVAVGETLREIDLAGRDDEMAYQMTKKAIELRRDIEAISLENQASDDGAGTGIRKAGSLLAFIKTNTDFNTSDGDDPDYTTEPDDTRTDGTLRDWTQDILEDVMEACYTSGADPKMIMLGPSLKRGASSFAGLAETRVQADGGPTYIVAAADMIVTDFGTLAFVPNRWMRSPNRDALFLDPEYYDFRWLRAFRDYEMAKTGDAEKRMLICEWTLAVSNEKALGGAFDLQRATP